MKIPQYLSAGSTIGITCPAGYMASEKAQTCIQTLQQWGYNVMVGHTLGSKSNTYFSGTDVERAAELQAMLDSPQIDAILCGRGGYGVGRIIDSLDFTLFKKNPKWLIGFSDITVLHSHIVKHCKVATLHAPMAAAFNDGGAKNKYVLSLKNALQGIPQSYTSKAFKHNVHGQATGKLVGGNLSLLAHLVGTPDDIKTDGCILFLEDVGEQLYNIDRMLIQLKRSGKLANLAGLVYGGFTDSKDTDRPFGKKIHDLMQAVVAEYNYPVCYNFPVSHNRENYALKCGVNYSLSVDGNGATLAEL
jgi:muramoyltetrapeptide carboxypeptidase